jgi:hypothetical protein
MLLCLEDENFDVDVIVAVLVNEGMELVVKLVSVVCG